MLKVEKAIRAQMDNVSHSMNKSLDAAEALCQQHGVTRLATYDTQALEMEIGVISSTTRRYLEVLLKLDQLMPMLQTLEIHDVLTLEQVVNQRSILKRQVRNIALSVRGFANGLRRRMHAVPASVSDASTSEKDRSDQSRVSVHADLDGAQESELPSQPDAEHEAERDQAIEQDQSTAIGLGIC